MTTMVERVARAIFDETGLYYGGWASSWEQTSQYRRELYERIARAAIEEMREPTEAMIFAAVQKGYQIEDELRPENYVSGDSIDWDESTAAEAKWQAGIDAALAEKS